jgi:type II secretory pathway component GspD/PulD (secretin)
MTEAIRMKTVCRSGATTELTSLALAGLLCLGLTACCKSPSAGAQKRTFSSFDIPARGAGKDVIAAGTINFQNAELEQVLAIYQELSRRSVIRSTLPHPMITVRNETPLTRVEVLQLLDTVLAQNGIAMVLAGETAVKAVPEAMAIAEAPPEITVPLEELPDSGSFMSRTVQLKKVKAVEVMAVLMPLTKTPNALLPIQSQNLLVIRDYSANVKRMLKMLQELEKDPEH